MDLNSIGIEIATARKSHKLSQLRLAQMSGVSRPTLDLLENGRATDLGYSKLMRILAALGLELRLQPMAGERPTLDDLLREGGGND